MIGRERRVRQERLEHLVFVGVDGALHDVLAQAPGRVDDHDLVESPLSVSIENITPDPPRSERTMSCTPIDSATWHMVEALEPGGS